MVILSKEVTLGSQGFSTCFHSVLPADGRCCSRDSHVPSNTFHRFKCVYDIPFALPQTDIVLLIRVGVVISYENSKSHPRMLIVISVI